MKREALLLYVRELRDLEIAKITVEQKFQTEMNNYDQSINELQTAIYEDVPLREEKTSRAPIIVALIGIFLICFALWTALTGGSLPKAGGLDVVIVVVFGIIMIAGGRWFYLADKESKLAEEEVIADIIEYNRSEKERVRQNAPTVHRLTMEKEQRQKYWQEQYSQIIALRDHNYSLNVLPKPYRNLAALIYIYEYMSTSNESLRDALLHEHLENGIQRILEKLDTIIAQNRVLIFQNRIAEAKSQTLIDQNAKMLSLLEQTEENTSEAKQYAELAANYSKANAYFTLADYLEK